MPQGFSPVRFGPNPYGTMVFAKFELRPCSSDQVFPSLIYLFIVFVVFLTFYCTVRLLHNTVDGKNFAKILTHKFWTSFAQVFCIRCLAGDTRTFSQASRRFFAYVFQEMLTFKRKNLS